MIKTKKDLTGQIFGRLTVIKRAEDYVSPSGQRKTQWLCQCICGSQPIVVKYSNLTKKNGQKSCGCIKSEKTIQRNKERHQPNPCDMLGEYGIGYTSKGEEFWFDKEDYDLIKPYHWWYSDSGYVVARDPETKKNISLHRLVMGVTDSSVEVDHKNHPPRKEHKKDNRKSNLEIVTRSENQMNVSLRIDNSSGKTGVYWNKNNNNWRVQIMVNKKIIRIGSFNNKEDAIRAREEAEKKYFGDHRYSANNTIQN